MTDAVYQAILVLNVLWFGAAFWYFAVKRDTAAKLLIPKSARSSPLFLTMKSALPFLGGMNLAFCLLAVMLLLRQDFFTAPQERVILLITFAAAHATQFLINIPVAMRGGRIGDAFWDVLKGPMFFIFVVDALMTLINVAGAALLST